MSYTNTDGRADMLNAESAHDTGLYDPAIHDNHIVAMYETNTRAHAARDSLVAAGISQNMIRVVDADTTTGLTGQEETGIWGAIKSLFVPDEEVNAYGHALHHGHAMLIVEPDATTDRSRIIHALESTEPVDFDAKLEEWRQAGYDYSGRPVNTGAAPIGTTAVGAAAGMASTGYDSDVDTTGTPKMAAPVANTATSTAAPAVAPVAAPVAAASTSVSADQAVRTDSPETLKVMEERLRVGKREVAQGAVRVRSYVVERPVEEQVRLHDERVTLERRPVDRTVSAGEFDAFQDRTIEARATAEEAVVSKEARVVEEIGLRKDAVDRTETVRDTVRSTKVEVEDSTKDTAKQGAMGTGGTVTNATPGATTSGGNTPRK